MTATLKIPTAREPQADASTTDPHFVLYNIPWETYEALLNGLGGSRVRMAYDNGTLEFMSPLPKHEREKKLLARLVEAYTEERNIPIAAFGQTTWRRRKIKKGLEPDECYYVRIEHLVRGRDDIELPKDPPPDLAIEVDVTHWNVDRPKIYAGLRVGELWNWEDERLTVSELKPGGKYRPVKLSLNLPDLPLAEIERFMHMRHSMGDTELIRLFRKWVREHFDS